MKRRILFVDREVGFMPYDEMLDQLENGEPYELAEIEKEKVDTLLPMLLQNVERYGGYVFLSQEEYNEIKNIQ